MSPRSVFISHASRDDAFVKELREALESHAIAVWVDSRELSAGDKLTPEIEQAIEQARHFIVVLSPHALASAWVRKEVEKAIEVEKQRPGYKLIPLLLPSVAIEELQKWFDEEPVALTVQEKPGGLSEALPQILTALGEALPIDIEPAEEAGQPPVEELILKLTDPTIHEEGGKRRARATATLVYDPADAAAPAVESKRFTFTAPRGSA